MTAKLSPAADPSTTTENAAKTLLMLGQEAKDTNTKQAQRLPHDNMTAAELDTALAEKRKALVGSIRKELGVRNASKPKQVSEQVLKILKTRALAGKLVSIGKYADEEFQGIPVYEPSRLPPTPRTGKIQAGGRILCDCCNTPCTLRDFENHKLEFAIVQPDPGMRTFLEELRMPLLDMARQTQHPEDSNLWYCVFCFDGGDISCCDRCPASFHPDCYKKWTADQVGEDEAWVCASCADIAAGGSGRKARLAKRRTAPARVLPSISTAPPVPALPTLPLVDLSNSTPEASTPSSTTLPPASAPAPSAAAPAAPAAAGPDAAPTAPPAHPSGPPSLRVTMKRSADQPPPCQPSSKKPTHEPPPPTSPPAPANPQQSPPAVPDPLHSQPPNDADPPPHPVQPPKPDAGPPAPIADAPLSLQGPTLPAPHPPPSDAPLDNPPEAVGPPVPSVAAPNDAAAKPNSAGHNQRGTAPEGALGTTSDPAGPAAAVLSSAGATPAAAVSVGDIGQLAAALHGSSSPCRGGTPRGAGAAGDALAAAGGTASGGAPAVGPAALRAAAAKLNEYRKRCQALEGQLQGAEGRVAQAQAAASSLQQRVAELEQQLVREAAEREEAAAAAARQLEQLRAEKQAAVDQLQEFGMAGQELLIALQP